MCKSGGGLFFLEIGKGNTFPLPARTDLMANAPENWVEFEVNTVDGSGGCTRAPRSSSQPQPQPQEPSPVGCS